MIASGVTVHEDGTVSYWIFQDQTPEEKERIRQLQEAEDKEKAKRREENKVIVKKSNDDMAASERLSRETSGSTSATTPLTADELNLAKEYKEFLDFSEALSRKANGETLDEKQKELIYGEKKPERFDTVLSFNGIQRFDMSMLYVDKTSSPAYGLPKHEYRFNAAANSISFGEGSKIPLGGNYLYIYDNITASFPSNYKKHPQNNGMKILTDYSGNGDCHALEELIYGVKNGNASWGNNMEVNGNILSLLNRMGVDTSKEFKINNVAFEVKDGVVQTKGYTASKEGATSGYSYLSGLLAKAYEQHLL